MTPEDAAAARQWLGVHPVALDALLAAAVYAAVLCLSVTTQSASDAPGFGGRDLAGHTAALGAAASAVLMLRRRYPVGVLAVTGAISLVELVLGTTSHPPAERSSAIVVTVVTALFTVATRTDRRTTWLAGLVSLAVLTPAAMILGQQPWYSSENIGVFAWIALAAAAGEAVRSRRTEMDAIRERAERAEFTREEEARRRVAEERMRIARELHDVVAHHISLVTVQAGVASHVMDTRPDQAKEALSHIRQAGRRALAELQTTVGLLRQHDEPVAPTEPAGGVAVLDDLVDGFVRTGMPVTLDVRVNGSPLPSAVDLAAYRVVQEALTNVRKHAGPGAAALVRVVRSGDDAGGALDVTVLDDGKRPAAAPLAAGHGGHGLIGMRERAAALDGTCEAGPLDGGGFRVRVTLPLGRSGPADTRRRCRERTGRPG